MANRVFTASFVLLCAVGWAACDSQDASTGGDADAFVGQWTFAGASVTVPVGGEIDVTNRVIGEVDESSAVFEEDGRFTMVVAGDRGRIENEGTYFVDEASSKITFDAVGFEEEGTFTYAVTDKGNRIALHADDVQFLLELSGLTIDGFTSVILNPATIESAEVIIFRKP